MQESENSLNVKFLDYIEEKSEAVEIDEDYNNESFPGPIPGGSLEMDKFDVVNDNYSSYRSGKADNYGSSRPFANSQVELPGRNLVAQSCDLDANRMNRSDRRNALGPDQMVRAKPRKNHGTQNLSMSTYVRNDNAFSVIQKDIASGQSKFHLSI